MVNAYIENILWRVLQSRKVISELTFVPKTHTKRIIKNNFIFTKIYMFVNSLIFNFKLRLPTYSLDVFKGNLNHDKDKQ